MQVPDEKFLVLVNDLLASGEIPDLLPDDEVENIISGVRNEVKQTGMEDSRENCWKFFIDRVRRQLKVSFENRLILWLTICKLRFVFILLKKINLRFKIWHISGGSMFFTCWFNTPGQRSKVSGCSQLYTNRLVSRVARRSSAICQSHVLAGQKCL